jgi:hypothetical protein
MPLRDSVSRHLQASCHTLDAPPTSKPMTYVSVKPPLVHPDGVKDSQIIFTGMPRPSIIIVIAQGDRYSKNVATLGFRK